VKLHQVMPNQGPINACQDHVKAIPCHFKSHQVVFCHLEMIN